MLFRSDPYTVPPDKARATYGPLKAHSEKEVERHYPGLNTIIRPGLIVGPLDKSDRFTYWPVRIDRGGEVIAPGRPSDPIQIIDSRDLAEWMIRMAESRTLGVYNAVGPQKPQPMAEMLGGIKSITASGPQFTWVPADFLAANGVRGWRHMPVWVSPEPTNHGFSTRNGDKAIAAGLTYRPLAVTAKDTLDWHRTRPADELKAMADGALAGISAEKEAEVLAAWHAKQQSGS